MQELLTELSAINDKFDELYYAIDSAFRVLDDIVNGYEAKMAIDETFILWVE